METMKERVSPPLFLVALQEAMCLAQSIADVVSLVPAHRQHGALNDFVSAATARQRIFNLILHSAHVKVHKQKLSDTGSLNGE